MEHVRGACPETDTHARSASLRPAQWRPQRRRRLRCPRLRLNPLSLLRRPTRRNGDPSAFVFSLLLFSTLGQKGGCGRRPPRLVISFLCSKGLFLLLRASGASRGLGGSACQREVISPRGVSRGPPSLALSRRAPPSVVCPSLPTRRPTFLPGRRSCCVAALGSSLHRSSKV